MALCRSSFSIFADHSGGNAVRVVATNLLSCRFYIVHRKAAIRFEDRRVSPLPVFLLDED